MNNQPVESSSPNNTPDNEKTDRPEINVVVAVAMAIALALLIVLVGVIAFKNSEVSTEVDVLESSTDLGELAQSDQLSADQIDSEVNTIVSVIKNLDSNVSELNNQNLSDQNLELTE